MKIESNRPIRPGVVRRDSKNAGGTNFADSLSSEPQAAPLASSNRIGGLEALFALQEVPDATVRRRQAVARGSSLLDRLEDLRLGLLTGQLSGEKIAELSRLAQAAHIEVDDPKLKEVLAEIDLRAQVELAKLSMRSEP
jgi:hypothetical protein